jgi:hypothetical protein
MHKIIPLCVFYEQGIWAQNMTFIRDKRNNYKVLVGKFEKKNSLGKSVFSWKTSFKNAS